MQADGWTRIAHNPLTGVSTWVAFEGEDIIVQERQDVAALLDENLAQKNIASNNWKGDGHHSVARIPVAMAYERDSLIGGAIKAGDTKVVNRVLNDSDYQKLRTKGGTL